MVADVVHVKGSYMYLQLWAIGPFGRDTSDEETEERGSVFRVRVGQGCSSPKTAITRGGMR